MTTAAEIEAAVLSMPKNEQQELVRRLVSRIEPDPAAFTRKALESAEEPPLDGLPEDLSMNTGDKVRALLLKRYGSDR